MNTYTSLAKYLKDTTQLHKLFTSNDCPENIVEMLIVHHQKYQHLRGAAAGFFAFEGGIVVLHDAMMRCVSEKKINGKYHTQLVAQAQVYRDALRVGAFPIEIEIVAHSSLRNLNNQEIYAFVAAPKEGVVGALYHSPWGMKQVLSKIDRIERWVGSEIEARKQAMRLDKETQIVSTPSRRPRM